MKKILLFALFTFLFYSCGSDDSISGSSMNSNLVRTNNVLSIGHVSANVFGSLDPNQLGSISAYGFCYGSSANPTISGSSINGSNVDSETGNFSCLLTSLSPSSNYHVRAYATIGGETKYGDDIAFATVAQLYSNGSGVTDVEGKNYPSIIINGKEWMKVNLDVSKYKNGDAIPEVTDMTQWDALTTGAFCYYANTTSNGTTYGKLYNWYAVNDPRGLAPNGWHVATDADWTLTTNFLGGGSTAGSKMKLQGEPWSSDATVSTNQSGFSALPAGYGYLTYVYEPANEPFKFINGVAFWWTSSNENANSTWTWNVNLNNQLTRSNVLKKAALSVRCVKN